MDHYVYPDEHKLLCKVNMREAVITVALPLGTAVAIITTLEYLLSTFAALCTRATVHGLWLLRLHRGGELPIDTQHRTRRRFQKDLISFVLGIWLVAGIALTESNLREGYRIREESKRSSLCVSVFGNFDPERVKDLVPPYRVTVEPWVVSVATRLKCPMGISSVGVGGATDSLGNKRNLSAPACSENKVNTSYGLVKADIGEVELEDGMVEPELGRTEAFMLFPLFPANLGLGIDRVGLEDEGNGICGEVGISGVFWSLGGDYRTTLTNAMNISFAVHERICQEYGRLSRSIIPLGDDEVRSCAESNHLNISCVRSGAGDGNIHTVDIPDVAALTVPGNLFNASYACIPATARVEFVFISAGVAEEMMEDGRTKLPVLLIMRVTIVEGDCERTIAGLAHAALLYTADSEWREDALSNLPRKIRFHAYLMAVSASQFPLHILRAPENPQGKKCMIRDVFTVTEILVDWRVWFLFAGLVAVAVVVLVGGVMRFLFVSCWGVGSAEWSLAQVVQGGGDSGFAVEIVRGDAFAGDERRKSRRGVGRLVGESVGWEQCEYRVRMRNLFTEDKLDSFSSNTPQA